MSSCYLNLILYFIGQVFNFVIGLLDQLFDVGTVKM